LANAVKFAPEYSTVDVACVRRHTDISVTVTDRGPGIDPQRLGQMFRRFARGFHNGPGDPGGVGLGLALVKVVADKHRGTVSVGQQPGETALRLILPLAGAPPP
jgi:signal transduction histidine kinase